MKSILTYLTVGAFACLVSSAAADSVIDAKATSVEVQNDQKTLRSVIVKADGLEVGRVYAGIMHDYADELEKSLKNALALATADNCIVRIASKPPYQSTGSVTIHVRKEYCQN